MCTSPKTRNAEALQRHVRSPIPYTIYTSGCQASSTAPACSKYADDTRLYGLLKSYNSSVDGIKREIQGFLRRCSNSFHDVNGEKTNERVIDFRDELVERVSAYKYVGVEIDGKLGFQECALNQSEKPQQRTSFLGEPNQFRSDSCVLQTFYKSAPQTVLFWHSVHFWKHACSTSEETTVHDQGSRWNQWSPPVQWACFQKILSTRFSGEQNCQTTEFCSWNLEPQGSLVQPHINYTVWWEITTKTIQSTFPCIPTHLDCTFFWNNRVWLRCRDKSVVNAAFL